MEGPPGGTGSNACENQIEEDSRPERVSAGHTHENCVDIGSQPECVPADQTNKPQNGTEWFNFGGECPRGR